ncbi:MAG: GNAT family N-acetyltransferase [Brevefilum sp.]|nr:GNAT family N-acetyltransferase [Brevefilum sp.]
MKQPTPLAKTYPLSQLSIRPVTRADLPALEWDGAYWMYREMYADLYQSCLAGRTLMWVVVEPGGELIGQVFVMLKSGERDAADGEERAYVFSFRVKSGWRNQGIGGYLMGFVEEDLRQRGFKIVTLNVAKENQAAQRLYQRLGYQVVGSRPGTWSFRDPDGVLHRVKEPSWRMMKNLYQDQ